MHRFSVDVDLTYLPLKDFETSHCHINEALKKIVKNVQKILPSEKILHDERSCELIVNEKSVAVKVEVSQIGRGSIYEPELMPLCLKAQEEFDAFVEVKVLNYGLLWILKVEIKKVNINFFRTVKDFLEFTQTCNIKRPILSRKLKT
jgi:hypothetical protein